MKKKIFIIIVVLFALFLSLPLFVSEEALPSKPSLLPQIYTANPLTPLMERLRRFAKELSKSSADEEIMAQTGEQNGKKEGKKKSFLARATDRLKDAWRNSGTFRKKQGSVSGSNFSDENEARLQEALAALAGGNSGEYVLGQQRAPQVSAKGMHDIKTKAAYEVYMRSSNYKPADEPVFVPRSTKTTAAGRVAAQAVQSSDEGKSKNPFKSLLNFRREKNKGGSSSSARSSDNRTNPAASTAQGRAKAWKDINRSIADIARMRADMKYPNPKTERERQARERMITEETAKQIREINDVFVADLAQTVTQNQQQNAVASDEEEEAAKTPVAKDDISGVILPVEIKQQYEDSRINAENPALAGFRPIVKTESSVVPDSRTINNDESDFRNSGDVRKAWMSHPDATEAFVLGPKLDMDTMDSSLTTGRLKLKDAYKMLQDFRGCQEEACYWIFRANAGDMIRPRSMDLAVGMLNSDLKVINKYDENSDIGKIAQNYSMHLLDQKRSQKISGITPEQGPADQNVDILSESMWEGERARFILRETVLDYVPESALSEIFREAGERKGKVIMLDGEAGAEILEHVNQSDVVKGDNPLNLAEIAVVNRSVNKAGKTVLGKVSDTQKVDQIPGIIANAEAYNQDIAQEITAYNSVQTELLTRFSESNNASAAGGKTPSAAK